MRLPVESPEVAALEEILQSRDLAIAIQGPAGAGKTTFAAEAVRAIEALSGKDVMVLAPSSSAVNERATLAGYASFRVLKPRRRLVPPRV